MQEAHKSLQSAAEALGLRLKPLDKKAEKALVQSQQEDLRAQLAGQADSAAALSLVVPLLVMQVGFCHTVVHYASAHVLQWCINSVSPVGISQVKYIADHPLQCPALLHH